MQPKHYSVSDHDINPNLIDPDALTVLEKLREAGYVAYLVGGSVRDLLLKRTPKDFDISTSALPEQVKQLFKRQCLIIGRRFRLAHVRFGHKVIEVATFRAGEEQDELVVQDNVWGEPIADALRRDFTINGLFYDPSTHTIIDYVGGWEDIHQNTLRTIGSPEMRFRQDPVRMLRLLKFRARFGFKISLEAKEALKACKDEILKSSQARILEEMLRMMESGASAPFFSLLQESGILGLIYPILSETMNGELKKEILTYLTAADKMNQSLGKHSLSRSVLFATLFFPMVQRELRHQFLDDGRIPHLGEIIMLVTSTLKRYMAGTFIHFPRRLAVEANSLLMMQYRLTPLAVKKNPIHSRVFRYKEFEEALTLLKLRALVDKDLIDSFSNWKNHYRQFLHQSEHRKPAPEEKTRAK